MSGIFTLIKREFMAYFYSPMAYAIMTVFMLLSGILFSYMLLSTQNAGIMRDFLSYLTVLTLLVSPMITMRLFAEEKKSGTIEMLMTAPVSEYAVVAAKFTAALLFYFFILSPTIAYVIILAVYGNPDFGAIISGYIGLICTTTVFFSIGIFISSLTSNQIVSAIVTLIALMGLLMLDLLADSVSGVFRGVLYYADFNTHIISFSKGLIDTRDIVFFASTGAFFLFMTAWTLENRRRKFTAFLVSLLATVIALGLLVEINYLNSRHYLRKDITFAQEYELADITKNVLKQIPDSEKVELHLLRKYDEIYSPETGRQYANTPLNAALLRLADLVEEYMHYSKSFEFTAHDMNAGDANTILPQIADKLGAARETLRGNDIIVSFRNRTKIISVYNMFVAENTGDFSSPPAMKSFLGEDVITSALRELLENRKTIIYFLSGHKELDKDNPDDRIGIFGSLLPKENCELKKLDKLAALPEVPLDCDMLVIASPLKKFHENELDVIMNYISRGGRLFLLMPPTDNTGIEKITAELGLRTGNDRVMEGDSRYTGNPALGLRMPKGQFYADRFGAHPVTEKLAGTSMLCGNTRSITPAAETPPAGIEISPLLMTTEKGWGETDYKHSDTIEYTPGQDLQGPVTFVTAVTKDTGIKDANGKTKQARIVAAGSRFPIEDTVMEINPEFSLNAVRWLTEKENIISIPRKNPENRFLQFSESDATALKWLLRAVIPLFTAVFGLTVWLIRRK